jgi:hypothetical protein
LSDRPTALFFEARGMVRQRPPEARVWRRYCRSDTTFLSAGQQKSDIFSSRSSHRYFPIDISLSSYACCEERGETMTCPTSRLHGRQRSRHMDCTCTCTYMHIHAHAHASIHLSYPYTSSHDVGPQDSTIAACSDVTRCALV